MSDFDVKEKRFEEDIEDYLTHHGGYTKGDPKKFNRESGLEEDTFVEFIKTSQPKKWERYVKIYAENSEKQIIERFKRSKANESFECDAAWIYGQRNQVLSDFLEAGDLFE